MEHTGAEFDGAYEVARNHKYMDAIAGAVEHYHTEESRSTAACRAEGRAKG